MTPPHPATILHITTRSAWNAQQHQAHYVAPSLESEGFIHCSTPAQLLATAARYYTGASDLVVLVLDPDRLSSRLAYEVATGGQSFPHVHGPIAKAAVVDLLPLEERDGQFQPPAPWVPLPAPQP